MRRLTTCRLAAVAAGLLITPLAAGLTAAAAQAASAVTKASLQVSSSSAGATNVVYSVSFMATDPLTSGSSTITLTAAGNTRFPTTCATVTDDATESSGCGSSSVTVTGSTSRIVITSPVTAAAGDMVSVQVGGITNPSSAGSDSLKVATSSDRTAVALPYTLAAKTAVSSPTLELSSLSASATQVAYSLTFKSPGRLAASSTPSHVSTVTLTAPSGTKFPAPGAGYDCFDATSQAVNLCNGGLAQVSASGSSVTIPVSPVNPGDVVSLVFGGISNPATAGHTTLTLSTSSDPQPVSLAYTLVAKKPVIHPFLRLSSYKHSATGVTWSVGFTAPDRLSNSVSTITLKAPSGTTFPEPSGCDTGYTFIDPAAGVDTDCVKVQLSDDKATATVTMGVTTSPGDVMSLVISGVTNPGSGKLEVSTSSDPRAVSLPLSAATTAAAAAHLDSTSASAAQVQYATTFVLTGALTTTSTIRLGGPAHTVFPTGNCLSGYYVVYDLSTGADAADCYTGPAGASVSFTGNVPAKAGDELAVIANSVTSTPAAGGHTLAVTTSTGGSATPAFTLTAAAKVTAPILHVTSLSASATGTDYAVTFHATNGLFPDYSSATLSLPGVCWPAGSGDADGWGIFDDTTGLSGGASATYSGSVPSGCGNGSTAVVTPGTGDGFNAAPGDVITLFATGTGNPATPGPKTLSLFTSGDPTTVGLAVKLTKPSVISLPALNLSSHQSGATNVTYAATFRVATGLYPTASSATLSLPGVCWPPGSGDEDGWAVYDDTTGLSGGASATYSGSVPSGCDHGSTAVVTVGTGDGFNAAPGDVVTFLATPGTNPPKTGQHVLQLSTSTDPVVTKLSVVLTSG
jgi:hypothetical protein